MTGSLTRHIRYVRSRVSHFRANNNRNMLFSTLLFPCEIWSAAFPHSNQGISLPKVIKNVGISIKVSFFNFFRALHFCLNSRGPFFSHPAFGRPRPKITIIAERCMLQKVLSNLQKLGIVIWCTMRVILPKSLVQLTINFVNSDRVYYKSYFTESLICPTCNQFCE